MLNVESQVLEHFKKQAGLKSIDKDSNIADDKYKYFDLDAEFLMQNFFKRFNIDHDGFAIETYFYYPDCSWKDLAIVKLLFKKRRSHPQRNSLRVSHLIEVAKKGKWFEASNYCCTVE